MRKDTKHILHHEIAEIRPKPIWQLGFVFGFPQFRQRKIGRYVTENSLVSDTMPVFFVATDIMISVLVNDISVFYINDTFDGQFAC